MNKTIFIEMLEAAKFVMKYSREQLKNMVLAVDVNKLQEDMIENGATHEELVTSSEVFHDVVEWFKNY